MVGLVGLEEHAASHANIGGILVGVVLSRETAVGLVGSIRVADHTVRAFLGAIGHPEPHLVHVAIGIVVVAVVIVSHEDGLLLVHLDEALRVAVAEEIGLNQHERAFLGAVADPCLTVIAFGYSREEHFVVESSQIGGF